MQAGSYVIDDDDDDPDLAVVVDRPGVRIDEWTVSYSDGEERTVAEDNPGYDPAEPTVTIAFVESGLDQYWPEWTAADPADLRDGVREHDVKRYSFPESRLTAVPDEQAAAMLGDVEMDALRARLVEMDALRARLDDAGWDLELTSDGVLVAEKMGERYRITPSGDVEGDGQIRTPLENIVAEYSG